MIHVRDIRKAIEGLSDDAIITAVFSTRSSTSVVNNFDLNLDDVVRVSGHLRQVQAVVSVVYTYGDKDGDDAVDEEVLDAMNNHGEEDDEKKESDYADEFEFNLRPAGWVGGHYAAEQDYNANALIPGAEPNIHDPRD